MRRDGRDGRVARLRRADLRDHVFARRESCADGITNGNGRTKRSYASRGAAVRAAAQMAQQHDGLVLRAYRCSCRRWHLTSQEKR